MPVGNDIIDLLDPEPLELVHIPPAAAAHLRDELRDLEGHEVDTELLGVHNHLIRVPLR